VTAPVRRVSVDERRARLGLKHRLAEGARASDPVEVARDLVALHATDAASVFLSAAARLREPSIRAIERVLYEDRSLIRMLGMRRTMFVVPLELMPVVHSACTQAIAAQERQRTIQLLQQTGITDHGGRWLEEVETETLHALHARGEALASELSKAVPRLNERVRLAIGKPYEGWQAMSTRVLFLLAADGRVVRGRPRGTWISSQHRWAPIDTWLPQAPPEISTERAQSELVRRWLASFGPGTLADLRWWTGLSMREVRCALDRVDTIEVDLDGTPGLLLAEDAAPVPPLEPWVALLPALDPTPMGWTGRAWYLGAHGPALFDRSGNVGPTVWYDGRVVGGWAQQSSGAVVFRLLEDIGAEATRQVGAVAERLQEWLGPVRITPRFRTPLERELSATS
jgi:hypothetical protein